MKHISVENIPAIIEALKSLDNVSTLSEDKALMALLTADDPLAQVDAYRQHCNQGFDALRDAVAKAQDEAVTIEANYKSVEQINREKAELAQARADLEQQQAAARNAQREAAKPSSVEAPTGGPLPGNVTQPIDMARVNETQGGGQNQGS